MRNDHIIVLKKIPVEPKHIGALRLRRDGEDLSHRAQILHDDTHLSRERLDNDFSWVYRVFSFLLFFAFLINPIGVAYAEEVTPLPDVPSADESTTADVPPAPPPGVTVVVPPSEGSATGGVTPHTEELSPMPNGEESTSTATSTEEIPSVSIGESGTSTATSTDEGMVLSEGHGGESTSGTSTDATASSTDVTESSTDEMALPAEEETMTNLDREETPEERAAERAVAEVVMREQIKKEVEAEMRARCVSYSRDGYYCLDDSSADRVTSVAPVEQVISERDSAGGDKEIVLVRELPEGESRTFITQNDFDDEFPSSDGEMRMIVWQANVGGRWQIAYKDGTGTIEYLTANQDGNGHPATDGKRIVWQGWSGSHWDIFLAEPNDNSPSFNTDSKGILEGIHPGWKITQLSHNSSHSMFPKIAGNFVTWQEHRGSSWVIMVYDLFTGQSRVIEGEAGGAGEAPTIALIFKERTPEGRVFIRASDLATGQRIPLRNDEMPEPAKLPIPEQSGALPLQSGTSSVTTIRPEGDGDAGGTPTL